MDMDSKKLDRAQRHQQREDNISKRLLHGKLKHETQNHENQKHKGVVTMGLKRTGHWIFFLTCCFKSIFASVFFCPLWAAQWASGPRVDDLGPCKPSDG